MKLADVPFRRRDARELLGLPPVGATDGRTAPDLDYAGFGWTLLDRVDLEGDSGLQHTVDDVLLLALHSADHQPDPEEVELEFELTDASSPLSVRAPLRAFLRAHAPTLPTRSHRVVLAVCNPANTEIQLPTNWAGTSLYFPHGDVLAWLDTFDDAPPRIRLHARAWNPR